MKPVNELTASGLNNRLDSLQKKRNKITDKFIRAGRGNEKPAEIWKMSDKLAQEYKYNQTLLNNAHDEISRRYGPGIHRAPTRSKNPVKTTYRGTYYFADYSDAQKYAKDNNFPTNRIISYERGWAIQLRVSGPYVGPDTKTRKSNPVKKKTARRKNPDFTPTPFHVVFKCRGNNIMFYMIPTPGSRAVHWSKDKKYGMAFFYKHLAERSARQLAELTGTGTGTGYKIGVAPGTMSAAEIKAQCRGK